MADDHAGSTGANGPMIRVEIAFALPEQQEIVELRVRKGTTASELFEQSGLQRKFYGIDFSELRLGVFSRPLDGVERPLPTEYVLEENDRVEIYRPLEMDPKQARLQRAAKAKK